MSRFLAGSDVGFAVPGLGIFVPPNLTPDATGLGNWTTQQIATAITTGERPDGRILAPTMPSRSISQLTKSDAEAVAVYLTLPPVHNKVPGPLGLTEKPTVSVSIVLQPDVYSGLPANLILNLMSTYGIISCYALWRPHRRGCVWVRTNRLLFSRPCRKLQLGSPFFWLDNHAGGSLAKAPRPLIDVEKR